MKLSTTDQLMLFLLIYGNAISYYSQKLHRQASKTKHLPTAIFSALLRLFSALWLSLLSSVLFDVED